MQKDNIFRSSPFHMNSGDVLHIIVKDEVGDPVTINLTSQVTEAIPHAPITTDPSEVTFSSFTANWYFNENTSGYYLDIATDVNFTSMVLGYDNLNVGNVNNYIVVGLDALTNYYYRIRAFNEVGISDNSATAMITTVNEVITDIDGNVYTYVRIGSLQWMVQNLRTTRYADGTPIPNVTSDGDWAAEDGSPSHDGAYCAFDNNEGYAADYGYLYNWYARINVHGLAPSGWRVATRTDWTALINFLGGEDVAGGKLKETGTVHWTSPNIEATDEYGFSALPGGERHPLGIFFSINDYAFIGCATEFDASDAYWYNMGYNHDDIYETYESKKSGFSVRCVRDIS